MDRKKKRLSSLKRTNPNDGTPTQSFSKSLRRVSFSNTNCVKEFLVGEDRLTIWGTSYEEEDGKNPAAADSNAHLNAALNDTSNTSFDWKMPQTKRQVHLDVPEHDKENFVFKLTNETLDATDLPNVTASFDYRSFNELPDITLNSFEEKKFRSRKESQKPNSLKPATTNISQSIHCSFLTESDRQMLKGIQPIADDVDNTIRIDWFHNQLDKIGFDNIETNWTRDPVTQTAKSNDSDDMEVYSEKNDEIGLENEKGSSNQPNKANTRKTIVFQDGDDLELDLPPVVSEKFTEPWPKRQTIIPQDDKINIDSPIDRQDEGKDVSKHSPTHLSSKIRQTMHFNNEQMMVEEAQTGPSVKQPSLKGTTTSSISAQKTATNTRQTILFNDGEIIDAISDDNGKGTSIQVKETKNVRKTLVFRAGEDICDMSSALNDRDEAADKQLTANIFAKGKTLQMTSKSRQTILFGNGESMNEIASPPIDVKQQNDREEAADKQSTANIFAKGKTLSQLTSKSRQTILFGNGEIMDEIANRPIDVKQQQPPLGFSKKSRNTEIFTSGEDICEESPKTMIKNTPMSQTPAYPQLEAKRRQTEVFKNQAILEETMCDKNVPVTVNQERLKTSRQTFVFTAGEDIQDISMNQRNSPMQQERKLAPNWPGLLNQSPIKSRHTEIFRNDEILEETMCGRPDDEKRPPVGQDRPPLRRQTEIFTSGGDIQEIDMEDCNAHSTENIALQKFSSNRAVSVQLPAKLRHTEVVRNDDILEETLSEKQQPTTATVGKERSAKQSRQTEIFQTGEDIRDISMDGGAYSAGPNFSEQQQSPAKTRQTEVFKNDEIIPESRQRLKQSRTTQIFTSGEDIQEEKISTVAGESRTVEMTWPAPCIKSRQTHIFTHDQILEDSICDPVLAAKTFGGEPQKSSRPTQIFQAGEAIQDISVVGGDTEQRKMPKTPDDNNWSIRLPVSPKSRETSLLKSDPLQETMSGKKMGPLQRARQTQLFAAGENDISTDESRKFAHVNSRVLTANRLDRSIGNNSRARSIFEDSAREMTADTNTTKSILRAMGGPLSYSRSFQINEDTCDMSLGKLRNQSTGASQLNDRESDKVPSILQKSVDRPFAQVSLSSSSVTKPRQTIIFDRGTAIDESLSEPSNSKKGLAISPSRKTQIFTSDDPMKDSNIMSGEHAESGPNTSFQFTKPENMTKSRAFAAVSNEPSNVLYQTLIYNNGEDICEMSMLADEQVPLVENSNQSHAPSETTLTKSGPLFFTAQTERQQQTATRTQPPVKKARHTQLFANEGIVEETSYTEMACEQSTQNTLRESVITHSNQKLVIKSESTRRTFVFAGEDIETEGTTHGAAKEQLTQNCHSRRRTHIFQDEEIAIEADESVVARETPARETVLVDNTKSAESQARPCKPDVLSHHKDVRKTLVFATGNDIKCESPEMEMVTQSKSGFQMHNPHKSITFRSQDDRMDQTLGFVPLSEESSQFIDNEPSSTQQPSHYENNSVTTNDIRLFRKRSVNFNRTTPYPASERDLPTADSSPAFSANTTAALGNLDVNAIAGVGFQAELEKNAMLRKYFKSDYAEVTVDTIRFSPSVYMGEDIEKSHIDLVESFDSTNPESESLDSPEVIELCEASVMIVNETIGRATNMTSKETKEQQQAALCRKCKNCRLTILNDSTWPDLKLEVVKEKPKLNFDMIERLQGRTSIRDVFNEIQNRRLSLQYSFDSASADEETMRFPEVPSMEFLLDNYADEFRKKLEEEEDDKCKCVEPIFPLDQPFNFLFKNRLETENCDWHMNDMHLPAGILECHNKTVRSICIVVRWSEDDLYKPGISQLEFKKVYVMKSPLYRNPSIFEKIVQNQILLTTPSDLTAYCNNSNNLFSFLKDMHSMCAASHQIMKQLLKATYANKGSMKFDESGNCIARKVIYRCSETVAGRRKIEFRIRIRNIEEISYKDILLPPQSYFTDSIRQLPTGVDFINSFFNNPVQYLRS